MVFYNVFFNFTHHSSIAEHRNKRKSSQRGLATDIEERSQLSGTATPSSSVSVLQYTYPEFTTESCEQLLNTKKPIRTSQWINSQRQEEQQQQLESRRSYGIGGAGNIHVNSPGKEDPVNLSTLSEEKKEKKRVDGNLRLHCVSQLEEPVKFQRFCGKECRGQK